MELIWIAHLAFCVFEAEEKCLGFSLHNSYLFVAPQPCYPTSKKRKICDLGICKVITLAEGMWEIRCVSPPSRSCDWTKCVLLGDQPKHRGPGLAGLMLVWHIVAMRVQWHYLRSSHSSSWVEGQEPGHDLQQLSDKRKMNCTVVQGKEKNNIKKLQAPP